MMYTVNTLKVEDFARWKASWDAEAEMRREVGQKRHEIFQDMDDPNTVVLLIEWDNRDIPQKQAEDDDFKQVLKRAGVAGMETRYVEEIERGHS